MPRTDRSRGMPDYIPRTRPKDDSPEQTATTRRLVLADRKEPFAAINSLCIAAGNAWLTSVPGDIEVRIEATAGSSIPERLREAGYRLFEEQPGQRLVPHAITEQITRDDGTVIRRTTHAGIIEVQRFSFLLSQAQLSIEAARPRPAGMPPSPLRGLRPCPPGRCRSGRTMPRSQSVRLRPGTSARPSRRRAGHAAPSTMKRIQ